MQLPHFGRYTAPELSMAVITVSLGAMRRGASRR